MSLDPSDEQRELVAVVRDFLRAHAPVARTRALMDTDRGYDEDVWRRLGAELGLPALAVPEAYGGAGFGMVELGLVFEELGRALYGGPMLSSVAMGATAVLAAGSQAQRRELLPGIAGGTVTAAVAVAECGEVWDAASIGTEARPDGLHGTKTHVVDGHTAGLLVVVAREPGSAGVDGVGMYLVEAGARGLTREPLPTLDQTRKLARLTLDGVPAARLTGDGGWRAVLRTLRVAAICLAAEQVGGAARCLELAVEHAKTRTQFGRPIGGFQAIKHRCADLLLAVETARSAAYWALDVAAAGDSDELAMAASLALSHCSEVYERAAADSLQIHGGLGFTWEHDAHLYLKRATGSAQLLGGPDRHRELIAGLMGL